MKQKHTKRPTIGMLTDWSENPYQTSLRSGIVEAAEEKDVNIICFIGGALNSSNQAESQRNQIYKLISKNIIDGLVISSAAIGHFIPLQKMKEFCARYCDIPMVSIALALEDIPSVLVDNTSGMLDLMEHLILHHNYRKIAFIGGPEHNPEAASRYIVYREQLKQHKIFHDDKLVVEGDFTLQTGIDAVKILLDKRKSTFDAIIAANDEMAFGALSELQDRGIRVPGDVAIVGFDDVEESKYYSPALTTVRQPLYEQGKRAIELLLQRIEGRDFPKQLFLPTELIIRESCGCLAEKILNISVSQQQYGKEDFQTIITKNKKLILSQLQQACDELITNNIPAGNWVEKLFNSFYRELVKKKTGDFLFTLNALLYQSMTSKEAIMAWQNVLSIFRQQLLPCLADRNGILRAETIWQQARIMIAEIGHRYESMCRLKMVREDQSMRDLSEKLITKIELEPLLEIIETELPKIGINTCFLALYEDKTQLEKARLILAFNEKGRLSEPGGKPVFPCPEIIPPGLAITDRRYTLMVEALFYGNEQLGFGLFEMGPRDGRVYEMLRLRLSSALRGTLLFRSLQEQADNLEAEVEKRTADLVTTNGLLQQEITERKHAEEELMRSNLELEQFAYIASHDLQEPLRMIGSFVGLLARRYQDRIDEAANEYIEFAIDGVNRMKNMINDLLIYSRVKTKAREKALADFTIVLKDAIQSLQFVVAEKQAVITYDPLPSLPADVAQIRQLFQNLLSNALKFQREIPPRIHISAREEHEETVFSVSDNGIGMDPEYKENIFIMFKRLHAKDDYPGTGIGLAICKKIIELHDGQIWVDSVPGEGSTFYFTIPKKGVEK